MSRPLLFVSTAFALSVVALLMKPADAAYPTNNDPTNQIRFSTSAGADAKRQQLINYVWSGGLPTSTLPSVTTNISFPTSNLNGINQSLVSRVDKLDANILDMDEISYLIHPNNTANVNRLAIVEQGHQDGLVGGVGDTANSLLQAGFSVIAMQMPMSSWNTDHTVTPPGGGTVTIADGYCVTAHNDLFAQLGPTLGGGVFRFFLEPVVQNINYFEQQTGGHADVSMIGLSGGGWTSHLAAAVDTRIQLSVPVAGSAPLYARNANPSWTDDAEQTYQPLYGENIAPDGSGGGVATWLEIYALGGYGDGRRQIMVTNQYDSIFNGTFADSFKDIVGNVVSGELGAGEWEHFLDSTHVGHEISPYVINNVILPAILVPEPSTFIPAVIGLIVLGWHVWRRRRNVLLSDL